MICEIKQTELLTLKRVLILRIPYLREDNVSLLFSYRSIGVFVGSCLSGYFFPKLGGGKWKLFSLGVILCVDAFGLAVMPILKGLSQQ